MKFCQTHWDQLRTAINDRGLSSLVSDSGEKVMSNLVDESERGSTVDNFDPLMGAHMAIWNNAMTYAEKTYMQDPMLMMVNNPEHPEWECPICFLNWLHSEHDAHCVQPDCNYPKEQRYEWMIDRAADDMVTEWKKLKT